MLTQLSIRNVGLIEKSDIHFHEGFSVVTGETGAGKSMLMDALSLTLGARADFSRIRMGAESAEVTAVFENLSPIVQARLQEMGLETEEGLLILRRVLKAEKSQSFANSIRITQAQMKALGDELVDLHGQHDHQRLLQPESHRLILDRFLQDDALINAVKTAYQAYAGAKQAYHEACAMEQNRAHEEELLAAYMDELDKLAPAVGEEEALSAERTALMHAEKIGANMQEALTALSDGVLPAIRTAEKSMNQIQSAVNGLESLEGLESRLSLLQEESYQLLKDMEAVSRGLEPNPMRLEEVDDRLHALRACARKHMVSVDDLEDLHARFSEKKQLLEDFSSNLKKREQEVEKTFALFEKECQLLSAKRASVSTILAEKIEAAVRHLNMKGTRFHVQLESLPSEEWNRHGAERVVFEVATSPITPLQPIHKVASGGEMSRLMLALKQVFYEPMAAMTLVFDEIDTGVGGATAEAVGQAMQHIAKTHQVFSITHQPQVASRGAHHVLIEKTVGTDTVTTTVTHLTAERRTIEIARMLSGKDITVEATAAAERLLKEAAA